MAGNDISYHNKDILMKFLSECHRDKGLEAYGLCESNYVSLL
ncbi:hypothetical protein ACQKNI_17575 [Bacillus sp. NPDC094064]